MADVEITEHVSEVAPTDVVSRLDAMSLAALESALDPGAAGGGDGFGGRLSLASGGRIGGTGLPGASADGLSGNASDSVFDIAALDQRPRVVQQVPPTYPPDLRRRKVEGTVYVVFVVDETGRVQQPSVESSTDQAFQAPALEAVRRWRFEPGVVRGQKVRSKLRVPIRFVLNG
jgi:protein TonB